MKAVILRSLVGIGLSMALAGCAQSLVYNEARDKQGQEAKRAAAELRIIDRVKALEKSYAEVANLELERAGSFAETLRIREIARVAREPLRAPPSDTSDGGLITSLEARMREMGVKTGKSDKERNCGDLDCGSLKLVQATPRLLASRRQAFELSRAEFRAFFGYDFRTCADVNAAAEKDGAQLKQAFAAQLADAARRSRAPLADYYKDLHERCERIAQAEARFKGSLENTGTGSIIAAWDQADLADRDIAQYRANLADAQKRLQEAIAEYTNEEKKLAASGRDRSQRLEKDADGLRQLVESIRTGADATGMSGSHAAAKELVSELETVLGAVAGQTEADSKLDPGEKAAVAFVRAIPQLTDEADRLLKEAGRPRLVPFAIAREHFLFEVKGFEDALAIKVRRAEALRAHADSLASELAALARVHLFMTQGVREWERQTITQLAASSDVKDRQRLFEALAIYWDEVFAYRSQARAWAAKASALRYEEDLARSKSAALQWDNLIGGVSMVLADYHASGVKSEEIAEFLKAFGLVFIGARID